MFLTEVERDFARSDSLPTLSERNGAEVIGFHNISVNGHVGFQCVAAVTDPCVIDEDVYVSVTAEDLLGSLSHAVRFGQVEDDSAGSESLQGGKKLNVALFH